MMTIDQLYPPHVTVLVPWVADPLAEEPRRRLAAAVRGLGQLVLTFGQAESFGNGTVWLRPEPWAQVRTLIRRVLAAFPECPPYGGAHPDPRPHLTVSVEGGTAVLAEVRAALADSGPLTAEVRELGIWTGVGDRPWRQVGTIPLIG